MTLLLPLHDRQDCGDAVQQALDVDIDLAIPLVAFAGRHGADRHDSGIVHYDIDAIVRAERALNPRFDLIAQRYVDLEANRAAARVTNVPDEGIDSILPPRAENDLRTFPGEQTRCAFTNAAARPRDDYHFLCKVQGCHVASLPGDECFASTLSKTADDGKRSDWTKVLGAIRWYRGTVRSGCACRRGPPHDTFVLDRSRAKGRILRVMTKRTKRSREVRVVNTPPLVSVVDDDESVRESLPDLLRELGFAARAFASARDFLTSDDVAATNCLLLDIAMPGMSGPDLQRELTLRGQAIPTIFITARTDRTVRLQLLEQGAVECLFKPFSEQQLRAALASAFRRN